VNSGLEPLKQEKRRFINNLIEAATLRQSRKTSLDSYTTILAMENKTVTKKILQRSGVVVPDGADYSSIDKALMDYPLFCDGAIVIKPNSTNFGLGITIFKNSCSLDDYRRGLEIAFEYDSKVLVEKFVTGLEYRFFVIDNQTVAILHREPANIIGDGVSSIAQLVAIKNQDSLRGSGYVTPLEKIKLGEAESMYLSQQGLSFDSIPLALQKIYLRENSNISTGGDSLDYTDIIPDSYKRLAVKAAASVNAVICGVDMMIRDINNPYTENNYAVIELNFNPAIHIHTYPYQGQDRKLAERILQVLRLIE